MEEKPPSKRSKPPSLAEIDLPSGEGPSAHLYEDVDPRVVEAHFAVLSTKGKSAEERWAKKCHAAPFRGL